jgi:hypothetical protein
MGITSGVFPNAEGAITDEQSFGRLLALCLRCVGDAVAFCLSGRTRGRHAPKQLPHEKFSIMRARLRDGYHRRSEL